VVPKGLERFAVARTQFEGANDNMYNEILQIPQPQVIVLGSDWISSHSLKVLEPGAPS
jgi:hypothetical protein